ncbi:transcriptional regulator family: Histone-like TF [Penicillium bovifimosum]|uniref:DNA polymerase epsilon subunit D n=1 Tax=Penicillium bovifimosum TaxID=126998 RepID=A0A9W9H1A8_9EURO|nr:transcriptional regulator family: Histone-like TF [Penicillium bovifimosum]KAJ5135799.1 transcriptional regulator family: Histone-like TF [Penicillium bovifimosum]
MPPRKSTSSVTPADPDDSLLQSPEAASEKPVFATEQQLKARAEAGASVEVSSTAKTLNSAYDRYSEIPHIQPHTQQEARQENKKHKAMLNRSLLQDYLLPRSLTIRLAKSVLPPNTTIQKDAVLAMQKAATVFVSYLSSQANDGTLKRTIAPSDVFNALSELELGSFRGRLERELEAYTDIKAGKRKSKKADANGETQDALGGTQGDDGDEEDVEEGEEEEEEEEDESEDEEEEEGDDRAREDDLDHVEDLDREPGARRGPIDPDAEETDDDENGPGSQLRDDLGLG